MDSVLDNGVTEENADYVECDFIWEFHNKIRVDKQYPYKNKKEMLSFVRVVAWNKLIKRQLIIDNNLEFPKGLRYEDVEFTYKLIPFINKFAYVDKPFIHYVQRKGSIANVQNERTAEIFTVLDNVIEFYKKIHMLDINTRAIIYLKIIRNVTFKEISQILGKNEELARTKFYRGKLKLKESLKNEK